MPQHAYWCYNDQFHQYRLCGTLKKDNRNLKEHGKFLALRLCPNAYLQIFFLELVPCTICKLYSHTSEYRVTFRLAIMWRWRQKWSNKSTNFYSYLEQNLKFERESVVTSLGILFQLIWGVQSGWFVQQTDLCPAKEKWWTPECNKSLWSAYYNWFIPP